MGGSKSGKKKAMYVRVSQHCETHNSKQYRHIANSPIREEQQRVDEDRQDN